MSTPLIGANALVFKDTTEIGYCKGVNVGIDAELVKEYKIGAKDPEVLEAVNKTYKATIDKMYIDKAYGELVAAGTSFSLEIRPQGTGATKPKIVLANFVCSSWEMRVTQDGLILEAIEGEGKSITFGTQT